MTETTKQTRRGSVTATATMSAAALVAALATTACSKDSPTEPDRALTPAAAFAIAPGARSAAGALLDDASGRLMPSLADAASRPTQTG